MTKNDLARALSERGYYKTQAQTVVDDIFDILAEAIVNKDKIFIRGFGTFEVKFREGKQIMNIKTKEITKTKDSYILMFRPGDQLKEMLQTGEYVRQISYNGRAKKKKSE